MKKIIKNPIFTFVLGALIFGGIVGVSAYTILATDIGYTPKDTTWKKSNGEDITNVKDAVDELYDKANSSNSLATMISFSYGIPSQSSTKNYKDLNKDVFAGLIGVQRLICIVYNNKLECFANNSFQNEKIHLENIFGSNCSGTSSYNCNNDKFNCIAYGSGDFICVDKINKIRCDLLSDNRLVCYDS